VRRLLRQIARGIFRRTAREAALKTGESPLDLLLRVMRDEGMDLNVRIDAAKAAAPSARENPGGR
jgi:hypothetical protein